MTPKHPRFAVETGLMDGLPDTRFLIAFDEVGRGCLAGPVMAGASLWARLPAEAAAARDPHGLQKLWIPTIRDSKALTERARKACFESVSHSFPLLREPVLTHMKAALAEPLSFSEMEFPPEALRRILETPDSWLAAEPETLVCLGVSVGAASVKEIDEINIWNAVQIAMGRAVRRLRAEIGFEPAETVLLVDGKLPIRVAPELQASPQFALVGGDAHSVAIGLASVIAKVIRDTYMTDVLNERYPGYELQKHKGYATKVHRDCIRNLGPSPMHRRSFLGGLPAAARGH